MSFFSKVAANVTTNFKSIMGIFGSGSTKDTPQHPELKKIQKDAENKKSEVDRYIIHGAQTVTKAVEAAKATKPAKTTKAPAEIMKEIAILTHANDLIECKGPGLSATPKVTATAATAATAKVTVTAATQMNTFANNSEQVDTLLVALQKDNEVSYEKKEIELFEASLSTFIASEQGEKKKTKVFKKSLTAFIEREQR